MAERNSTRAQPGWREVVLVAIGVVVAVLVAVVLTEVLPDEVQRIVYDTPFAIIVLMAGTSWLLWRISRRAPGPPDG